MPQEYIKSCTISLTMSQFLSFSKATEKLGASKKGMNHLALILVYSFEKKKKWLVAKVIKRFVAVIYLWNKLERLS